MAYYYQNPYLQQPQFQAPQQNNGLIWVQGEAGAKSYMIAPNSTVMLMDSESQRFFLKSTDVSGMPQPLRIFEYHETTQNAPKMAPIEQTIDYSSFATKAEFEAFRSEIEGVLKNIPRQVTRRVQSSVSRAESESESAEN